MESGGSSPPDRADFLLDFLSDLSYHQVMKVKYSSKTFFVGDPHFGHPAILRHCKRPFVNVDEMDKVMMANWNDMVKPGSTVYIMGDFAFKNHSWYLNRLNGKKILIEGNHDKMSLKVKENFREVHTMLRRRFFGKEVTLCHYAMKTWASSFHGTWHLYGHSHGRLEEGNNLSFDVGVDVWDFKPVPWELIVYKAELLMAQMPLRFGKDYSKKNRESNRTITESFLKTLDDA